MEIRKLEVKDDLYKNIPDDEKLVFVMMGHIANELNVLRKLVLMNSFYVTDSTIEKAGNGIQSLVLIKIFVAKVFEARGFMQKHGMVLNRMAIDKDSEISQGMKKLNQYFGKKNLIEYVRNKFGAHYDSETVMQHIQNVHIGDHNGVIYLTPHQGLILYHFQEQMVFGALNKSHDEDEINLTFGALINEVGDVADWIGSCAQGVMIYIGKRYANGKWEKPAIHENVNPKPHTDATIPYLVDFTGAVKD